MFLALGYKLQVKEIMECIGIVNGGLFGIMSIFFFLRYGSFIELKNVYGQLQNFILKLRYDKTEYEIEAYLNHNLENQYAIEKEIEQINLQLKEIESHKELVNQVTYITAEAEGVALQEL